MDITREATSLLTAIDRLPDNVWGEVSAYCAPELERLSNALGRISAREGEYYSFPN